MNDQFDEPHEDEPKSGGDSPENQSRSRLERLAEREKELEEKAAAQEEAFKSKENRLLDDFQKKAEELRVRWTQVEAELRKFRQEQLGRQQELERLYADKLAELGKRESAAAGEIKKQEAMLKWARDSFQAEIAEREKILKRKELDLDKALMEKEQAIEYHKVKEDLLQKQLSGLPDAERRRDAELERGRQAIESLEGVIRTLETERKNFQAESDHKFAGLCANLEAEKARRRELEEELPRRLQAAAEQERGRLMERLSEAEKNYAEDLQRRREETGRLEKSLKSSEEIICSLQAERDSASQKAAGLQARYDARLEEFSLRERQLRSEYDVRLQAEIEKKTSSLKNELETACRIYGDNLRLKVEEISHLRRELETETREKTAFQAQAAEFRRAVDSAKAGAETELAALRAQLKSACERRLADELAGAALRWTAEKKKLAEALEEQAGSARQEVLRKEAEIGRLRNELAKMAEEKHASAAEERRRGKAELQSLADSFSDAAEMYEDKISRLNKTLESLKLEREELILLERERLERLYSEKEKDFSERLSRKEREADRFRETLAELRGEADRAAELAAEKDRELDSLRLARKTREDLSVRTLEEFRAKLAGAVVKIEALKKASEERGTRSETLQEELAQLQEFFSQENSDLSARLADREKAAAREMGALRDLLRGREAELARFKARSGELEREVFLVKEQNRRQAALEPAWAAREARVKNLEAENARLRRLGQECERSKKLIEELKAKLRKAG